MAFQLIPCTGSKLLVKNEGGYENCGDENDKYTVMMVL